MSPTLFSKGQMVRPTHEAKHRGLGKFESAKIVSIKTVSEDELPIVGHSQFVTLDNGAEYSGFFLELVQRNPKRTSV